MWDGLGWSSDEGFGVVLVFGISFFGTFRFFWLLVFYVVNLAFVRYGM